jgi:cell division protein FtsL
VANGVVWIVVVAVLLAGVVAMNVAVLQLNLRLDDLGRERAKLRAGNAQLSSRLSSAAASAQIESLAKSRLGVVPASSGETTYLYLDR